MTATTEAVTMKTALTDTAATPTRPSCRRCDWRDERGGLGAMLVILVVACIALAGLVVDGGAILAGRRLAYDSASQAAQAGSQAIDRDALRLGVGVQLDPPDAHAAAMSWLVAAGVAGSASVTGDEITVTATTTVDMQILGSFGVGPKTVSGTASARAVRGVLDAET